MGVATPAQLVNQYGQKMGRKGLLTRQRIMSIALKMLGNSSYKDLTVSDLAAKAKVSNATFYVYFKDIEDVLFACVEAASLDMNAMFDILNETWTSENLKSQLEKFVDSFNTLWEKHRVELRIRNIEADQGNARFLNFRQLSTIELLNRFGEKLAELNPRLENPEYISMVIYTAMERLAALNQMGILGSNSISRRGLDDAIVELLYMALKK